VRFVGCGWGVDRVVCAVVVGVGVVGVEVVGRGCLGVVVG
jgi:hypothetical protein